MLRTPEEFSVWSLLGCIFSCGICHLAGHTSCQPRFDRRCTFHAGVNVPWTFSDCVLRNITKVQTQCIAGIQQGYGEQQKHPILYWMGGLWGVNDYLVSTLANLKIPLPWEKILICHGIPIQRAVLLNDCTELPFSHSPWSLKLYGCLCQRHSPIATNGSHGHCISVSAERLGVCRNAAVWFCWVWWSKGQFIP
jgi:hypothetical protein